MFNFKKIKQMKFYRIIPIAILILFTACDTIKNPIQEQTGNTCGDESTGIPIKKILVEEFTGQRCTNCPEAAMILHDIIDDYCDHIVPVAVHSTLFAAPNDDYPFDYRTDIGNELADYYGVLSLPIGMINRSEFEGNQLISRDNWRAAVNAIFNTTPELNIILENSYNDNTKEITTTVTTEFLSDINYYIYLVVYLTEDSIVSPQLDGSVIIEDYVHRHMLRKGVNGTFGVTIAHSGEFGDIIKNSYTFDADPEWAIEHCELVAFISKRNTNEIVQAESEPVIQD